MTQPTVKTQPCLSFILPNSHVSPAPNCRPISVDNFSPINVFETFLTFPALFSWDVKNNTAAVVYGELSPLSLTILKYCRKIFICITYGWKYEVYSESKYRFAIKNRVKFIVIRFYILQTIFPHIRRHYWGTYRSGVQVLLYPPHRMRPPAMLATTDNVIE